MIPTLKTYMDLYNKLNFKKITEDTFGNAILKMQMQKVVMAANLQNATVL